MEKQLRNSREPLRRCGCRPSAAVAIGSARGWGESPLGAGASHLWGLGRATPLQRTLLPHISFIYLIPGGEAVPRDAEVRRERRSRHGRPSHYAAAPAAAPRPPAAGRRRAARLRGRPQPHGRRLGVHGAGRRGPAGVWWVRRGRGLSASGAARSRVTGPGAAGSGVRSRPDSLRRKRVNPWPRARAGCPSSPGVWGSSFGGGMVSLGAVSLSCGFLCACVQQDAPDGFLNF